MLQVLLIFRKEWAHEAPGLAVKFSFNCSARGEKRAILKREEESEGERGERSRFLHKSAEICLGVLTPVLWGGERESLLMVFHETRASEDR